MPAKLTLKRLLAAWLLLLGAAAWGWETEVIGGLGAADWRSLYHDPPRVGGPFGVELRGNEHAEIAALALHSLGLDGLLELDWEVIDLNATVFRKDASNPGAGHVTVRDGLVRRALPSPVMFAGLPDFSYTIYDWINRNRLCPALPAHAKGREHCHNFAWWLGAGLNASHFGTQATLNYRHLHGIALAQARRARRLRERLQRHPDAFEAYADHVREAEYMALAYEGFAQHFLADRWSTGHMWERWGSGDYEGLASTDPDILFYVGILSGMIHGSESVLHAYTASGLPRVLMADPLSAPSIRIRWRRGGTSDTARKAWERISKLEGRRAEALRRSLPATFEGSPRELSNFLLSSGPLSTAWRAARQALHRLRGQMDDVLIRLGEVDLLQAAPIAYRHLSSGQLEGGAGDHVLFPLVWGRYGGPRYGFPETVPLEAPVHVRDMIRCARAGWSEVIRALGDNGEGRYGALGIPLDPRRAETFEGELAAHCFDTYVTNASMHEAWPLPQEGLVHKLAGFAAWAANVVGAGAELAQRYLFGVEKPRLAWRRFARELKRIETALWIRQKTKPMGTELADGRALPTLDFSGLLDTGDEDPDGRKRTLRFRPGNFQARPARYLPPVDLDALPDVHPEGRDKRSLYGFFSRAAPQYWQERAVTLARRLRGSPDPSDIAACAYLASMAYAGTPPEWKGINRERPLAPDGSEIPSFLAAAGHAPRASGAPVHLPAGYVSEPGRKALGGLAYASVLAWCRRVPLLEYLPGEQGQRGLVAVDVVPGQDFELRGSDLSDASALGLDGACDGYADGMRLFVTWASKDAIRVKAPATLSPGIHQVCILGRGRKSVGEFYIEVGEPPPPPTHDMTVGCYRPYGEIYYAGSGALALRPDGSVHVVAADGAARQARILSSDGERLELAVGLDRKGLQALVGALPPEAVAEKFGLPVMPVPWRGLPESVRGKRAAADDEAGPLPPEVLETGPEPCILARSGEEIVCREETDARTFRVEEAELRLSLRRDEEILSLDGESDLSLPALRVEDRRLLIRTAGPAFHDGGYLRGMATMAGMMRGIRHTLGGGSAPTRGGHIATTLVDGLSYVSLPSDLKRLEVLEVDLDRPVSRLVAGARVRVRGIGASHCPGVVERAYVNVWLPGHEEPRLVILVETSPGSGVYLGPETPIAVHLPKGMEMGHLRLAADWDLRRMTGLLPELLVAGRLGARPGPAGTPDAGTARGMVDRAIERATLSVEVRRAGATSVPGARRAGAAPPRPRPGPASAGKGRGVPAPGPRPGGGRQALLFPDAECGEGASGERRFRYEGPPYRALRHVRWRDTGAEMLERVFAMPGRMRVEPAEGDGEGTIVLRREDLGVTWELNPALKTYTSEPLPPACIERALEGEEKIEGRTLRRYRIRITAADGVTLATLWTDERGLPVRMIERRQPGGGTVEYTWRKVEATALDERLFELPEGYRPIGPTFPMMAPFLPARPPGAGDRP